MPQLHFVQSSPFCPEKDMQSRLGSALRPIVNINGATTYKAAKYLASLLKPLLAHSEYHILNSAVFAHSLDSAKISQGDPILVSSNVDSLFTQVSLEALLEQLLEALFPSTTVELF